MTHAIICSVCGALLKDGSARNVSHGLCVEDYIETLGPGDVIAVARLEGGTALIWENDEPVFIGYWRRDV